MVAFAGASHASSGRSRLEGPTWLALAACYGVWASALWFADTLGILVFPIAALAVAFHSSLQHEILHGHPTRNAALNEALVFPALGLFIPYRRFRDLHLRHHNDDRLTDPYDDPESFYAPQERWHRSCGIMRALLTFNATFAGRMIIGPGLAMWGFWSSEARLLRAGAPGVRDAWARHVLGSAPVVLAVWASGVPLWAYLICVCYPAIAIVMVRSYIEHRAHTDTQARTAVVEAGWFWRIMFLNNNYHAIHHERPSLAWYLLPAYWRSRRSDYLARNQNYLVKGYGEVVRRWLIRPREPVVHPLVHREEGK